MRLILSLFIPILLATGCMTDPENQNITEKVGDDDGIRTISYPKTFKNQEAYSIYLEGLKCVRKNDYQCCKERFERALAIDPNNRILLNDLGLTEKRLYNYDQARKLFLKAIALDSSYYRPYNNLGLTLYYDEKYAQAIEILKLVNIDSADLMERRGNYFHLFMNYTKLLNCDSAYHYYRLTRKTASNEIFLENVEEFHENEFKKNCPQQGI